jgi:hypothetical protein
MSMGGRWNVTLLGAGMALVSACDLSSLADKLAADFERGIQERADEEIRNAQKRIGEDGGEVKTYGGAVAVPEGAVEGDVEVAVAETNPAALSAELPGVLQPVTPPMAFTPHGTTFEAPVTLSLFFDRALPSGDLHVLRLDDEQDTSWERVDPDSLQYGSGVAMVSTTHFSVYSVVRCEALPGELAGVCDQLKNGEISLSELAQVAPPDSNAWEGFEPRPSSDGGTTTPPDDGPPVGSDACADVADECKPVFDACGQDPESSICERIPDCLRKLEECGAEVPTPSDEECYALGDGCRQGDTVACEIYSELCSGDSTPIDECSLLYEQCNYEGNQGACDKFDASCADGQPPTECEELGRACANGDEQACLDAEEVGCGFVEPPPPETCKELVAACDGGAGDLDACEQAAQLGCPDGGIEPPPPPPPGDDCISWFPCGPDDCREEVTCPPEPFPVPTDIKPAPGSYVDCYSEDNEVWSCQVYSDEPAPTPAP